MTEHKIEPMVMAIIEEWSRVRPVGEDRRSLAMKIRSVIQAIDYGTFGVDPDEVADAGGAGQWLLARTKAYADSDAGRGDMRWRYRASTFFYGHPPKCLDDPSDWVTEGRATVGPSAPIIESEPWAGAATTWKRVIREKIATGQMTEQLEERAVSELRRHGFSGTESEALAALGAGAWR